MNHDLISRKALVAALVEERNKFPAETAERYSLGVKLPNRFNQAIRGGIRKALRLVETAPAIDAVEIVHCRDCKHWGTGYAGETNRIKECRWAHWMSGENGYCVYGERKKPDV